MQITSPSPARSRLRRAVVATLVVAGTGIAGLSGQATAQPATTKVTGHVATQISGGPDCDAPSGQCFAGEIKGVVSGTVEAAINSITPTVQPDIALVDASVTIHTRDGDLRFEHEQIVYNINPTGRGEFSWILRITSGTGRYAGATGFLQGAGTAPPATGVSTSPYVGEIKLAH